MVGLNFLYHKNIAYYLIFSYLIIILLFPRLTSVFPISINVRLEDLLTPFLFIFFILFTLKKTSFNKYYFSITLFYGYILLVTFLHIIFNELHIYSLIIIGKLFQYYFVFTICYNLLLDKKYFEKIEKLLFILFSLNLIYAVLQLFIGKNGYYGIASIPETSPFLSGVIFFHSLVFMFYMNLKYKKTIYIYLGYLSLIATLLTVARLNIISSMVFLIIYTFLISNKKQKYYFIYSLLFIFLIFYFSYEYLPYANSIFRKFDTIYDSLLIRYDLWLKQLLHLKEYYNLILGMGISETNMTLDTRAWTNFGNAVDSQYIRYIIEIGIVGIILWIGSMYMLIHQIQDNGFKKFAFAYIVAMCTNGIGAEVFIVSKSGVLFLVFCVLIYLSSFHAMQKNKENMEYVK